MEPEDELVAFTPEDQEIAWEVNALLMALHHDSVDLYETILFESSNLPGLLVMATATLKTMVDLLIDTANETRSLDHRISFEELITQHAEFLTEMSHTD